MIVKSFFDFFSHKETKIILYYMFYATLYCFNHLVLTSVFSFFHFLLDHDLSTINNWLSFNGWEIISFSKIFSVIFVVKFLQFKSYRKIYFWSLLRTHTQGPSKKIFVIVFFILAILYALIEQYGGGVQSEILIENLLFSSFLGSSLFFFTDFIFLLFLFRHFDYFSDLANEKSSDSASLLFNFICGMIFLIGILEFIYGNLIKNIPSIYSFFMIHDLFSKSGIFNIDNMKTITLLVYFLVFMGLIKAKFSSKRAKHFFTSVSLLFIFTISSKLILPYLDKFLLFLIIHFVFLFYLLENMKALDMGIYIIGVIALLSTLFGIDLVWDNSYSMFEYSEKIPVLGIVGLWLIIIQYYKRSKLV